MTELVSGLLGIGFLMGVGYAGYVGGRDAAERKAAETIANLRRRCAIVTNQRDRAVEANGRMARTLGLHGNPEPPTPDWMNR